MVRQWSYVPFGKRETNISSQLVRLESKMEETNDEALLSTPRIFVLQICRPYLINFWGILSLNLFWTDASYVEPVGLRDIYAARWGGKRWWMTPSEGVQKSVRQREHTYHGTSRIRQITEFPEVIYVKEQGSMIARQSLSLHVQETILLFDPVSHAGAMCNWSLLTQVTRSSCSKGG